MEEAEVGQSEPDAGDGSEEEEEEWNVGEKVWVWDTRELGQKR